MELQELLIAIFGTGGLAIIGTFMTVITKLIKAGNELKVNREAEKRVATRVIESKDLQIESLSNDIAKLSNILVGVLEIVNLQAQTLQTNPELIAKYERIYNDVKSIAAFSFENGKKVLERTREKAIEIVQDVKTFTKEVEAATQNSALGEILKKAGI